MLLDSQPLVVLPELAKLVGINEAIILQQIHYWTNINREQQRNYHDGYYWTYNSFAAWQKQFSWIGLTKIKATFAGLKHKGLVVVGNYNKAKFDKTLWYRIDYEVLSELVSGIGGHPVRLSIVTPSDYAQPRGFPGNGPQKRQSHQRVAEAENNVFEQAKWEKGERGNLNDPQAVPEAHKRATGVAELTGAILTRDAINRR